MNRIRNKIRSKLKTFLLYLISKIDEANKPKVPVLRLSTNSIFKNEIKIHPAVISAVSFVALFFMIFMQTATALNVVSVAIGTFILLVFIYTFVLLYLYIFGKKRELDTDSLVLILFIFISSFLLFQVCDTKSPILFPMSAFTILLAMLVSIRISILYVFVITIIISAVYDFSAVLPMIHIAGSVIAILKIKNVSKRSNFVKIGINSAVAMILIVLVLFCFGCMSVEELENSIAFSMINAFISVVIVLSALPLLEALFSKTTNIKLVELADFNNVLLKRLMLEAPGTYHHCLMTASLAEQAADAIGVNSLLARVSAYYHDIGKLTNPEYFIENQKGAENPHDAISPSMSGLILISHVKDGVALAKKHKIDKVIIEAISQHHGTSLIQYFYNKAIKNDATINEQDFRYPGEKPKNKINAILMIADSVEAVSRTIQDKSAGKLKEVVEKIINNKFTDGQFSDCPITLKDLAKIAESMTNTLCGIFHARIDYKTLNVGEKKENKNE